MLFGDLFFLQAALVAISLYMVGWIIYCRYFHPLRSIPGPFLASFSRAWIVFKTAKGDMEHTQRVLHKKHGISHKRINAILPRLTCQAILFASPLTRLHAPTLELSRYKSTLSRLLSEQSLTCPDYLFHQDRLHQGAYSFPNLTGEAYSIRPITTMFGRHRTTDTSVTFRRVMRDSILIADAL